MEMGLSPEEVALIKSHRNEVAFKLARMKAECIARQVVKGGGE